MICIFRVYVVFLLVLFGCTSALAEAVYSLPDAELLSSEFTKRWGSGTLTSRTDTGDGVRFNLTMGNASDDGKIGIGDNYPVSSAAGLLWDDELHHFSSLAAYGSYQMVFRYDTGPANSELNLCLYMNTGLTGPSGYPSNDLTNNTYWQGAQGEAEYGWITIALGETVTVNLDFDNAWADGINDNQDPHTGGDLGWADQDWYTINMRDRHEISHLGFQVADFDHDALGSAVSLHVSGVPTPGAFVLLGFGGGIALLIRRRRKTRGKPVE